MWASGCGLHFVGYLPMCLRIFSFRFDMCDQGKGRTVAAPSAPRLSSIEVVRLGPAKRRQAAKPPTPKLQKSTHLELVLPKEGGRSFGWHHASFCLDVVSMSAENAMIIRRPCADCTFLCLTMDHIIQAHWKDIISHERRRQSLRK